MRDTHQAVPGHLYVVIVEIFDEDGRWKRLLDVHVLGLSSGFDDFTPAFFVIPIGFGQAFDDGYDRGIFAMGEAVVSVHAERFQVRPPSMLRFNDLSHDAHGRVLGSDDKLLHFIRRGEETEFVVVCCVCDHGCGFVADVADNQTNGGRVHPHFELTLLIRDGSEIGAVDTDGGRRQGLPRRSILHDAAKDEVSCV